MDEMRGVLENAVQDGIRDGVKARLAGYNSPIDKIIGDVLQQNADRFRSILTDAISDAVGADEFRAEVRQALRHKLATLLVSRFGGELEKQVNALRSNPTTRARITLAIEAIVAEKAT